MIKRYQKSLFIFRRDLRLDDNTGLITALEFSHTVIPCFIFDPRQIGKTNTFRSTNALQFMIESLQNLDQQLHTKKARLYLFYGIAEKVVTMLITQESIDAVFCNRDYTPFSIKRDEAIKSACQKKKLAFEQRNDLLLHEPEEIKTLNGTPYTIFTPFFKTSVLYHTVREPQKAHPTNFYIKPLKGTESDTLYKKILSTTNKKIHLHGGRTQGLKILQHIGSFKNYTKTHDIPAKATTNLSAHLKFGNVSIRETYHAIKNSLGTISPLLRQLYWRDFFTHVAYHSPFVFGQPYKEKFKNIRWENNPQKFKAWCQGNTGFPIVDAGIRQLNTTGFMHNRVRMIVASFLIKDLHIDWRLGERYFAQQLVDYDPSVNNGNWQWCASTGCDAQPYFRIFNPWLQQKKFDPECTYIKHWVPELKKASAKTIHALAVPKTPPVKSYPRPIIDHKKEATLAKQMYKESL